MKEQLKYLPLGTAAEKELVAGLRRGEPASYRHLYERFAPRLHRILIRIFSDRQLAYDATQTTFLIVFQRVDRFDGRASLLTWLTRIAINEARSLQRKNNRRPMVPLSKEEPPRTPEQEHSAREYQHQLVNLLRALPEEKRVALLLFEVEGFSVQEVADITGEPRGTLLSRLARTRQELQKELRCWSGESASATGSKVRGNDDV